MAEIDARIPLMYRPAESGIESPLESQAKITKLKTAQLEQQGMQLEQAQRAKNFRDQQQLQQIFTDHVASGGDPNDLKAVLPKVYAVNPMLGMSLQKQMAADAQKAALGQYEAQKAKHDAQKAAQEQADYAIQRMGGILQAPEQEQPRLYAQNRADWINRGLIDPEHMPEQYDPTWLKSVVAGLQHGTKNNLQWHETINAQGQPVGQFLPIEPGTQYPLAPKAANAEAAAMALQAKKNRGETLSPSEEADLKAFSDIKHPEKPVDQNKLEQQYRQVLRTGLQSGSSPLGIEHKKVNSAIHLGQLFDQAYDPKTGNYNIPKAAEEDLIMGLATLLSPNARVGPQITAVLETPTLYSKLSSLYTFVTGTPAKAGNTQDVLKMYKNIIDRQGEQAEENRDQELNALRALAPTDLAPERRTALESGELPSFKNRKSPIPKAKAGGGGTVKMVAPGGGELDVPEADVAEAERLGAKRK